MSDAALLVQDDASVVTLTFNRPAKRNALDLAAWRRLGDVMAGLAGRSDIRCVVLRGAGGHFAAGADISAFEGERDTPERALEYGVAEHRAVLAVAECLHPTVASIAGACVGGGLEIAAACDIRLAGASARFGAPINRLGLTMAHDELGLFVASVGRAAALELLLEGSVIDAERARQLSIVSRVVPDDALDGETAATVRRIISGAPLVNRWHKKFLKRLADPAPLTREELAEGRAAFATEDYRMGYRAFLEKRVPEFRGR